MATAYCPALQTERLILRPFREDDVDAFHAFYQDPLSQALFGGDVSKADVWRRIALFHGHWALKGFGIWAIEEKSTRRFAGYAGLWFPYEFADVEVGYGLHPAHRGRGYAVEAAQAARAFGRRRGITRLVSYIIPANARSVRVAERLGARPDGEFQLHGRLHTVYLHPSSNIQSPVQGA